MSSGLPTRAAPQSRRGPTGRTRPPRVAGEDQAAQADDPDGPGRPLAGAVTGVSAPLSAAMGERGL
ncbi:hypothetical protein MOTC310_26955 [Methylobacterium oryzae]|uniref:Uncharacterized protein n=1 Tax=Methylobacterium oryzae TaxID=334852 RepID=A0ABU7TVQ7_9HYPH